MVCRLLSQPLLVPCKRTAACSRWRQLAPHQALKKVCKNLLNSGASTRAKHCQPRSNSMLRTCVLLPAAARFEAARNSRARRQDAISQLIQQSDCACAASLRFREHCSSTIQLKLRCSSQTSYSRCCSVISSQGMPNTHTESGRHTQCRQRHVTKKHAQQHVAHSASFSSTRRAMHITHHLAASHTYTHNTSRSIEYRSTKYISSLLTTAYPSFVSLNCQPPAAAAAPAAGCPHGWQRRWLGCGCRAPWTAQPQGLPPCACRAPRYRACARSRYRFPAGQM